MEKIYKIISIQTLIILAIILLAGISLQAGFV
ncbi:hypothetical protein ALNOE001_16750 [Candidatus Methanobinarius endosymbioticus]|uniref:Uncharacterized protein n=1 Tax=Candidatus Methanobinarius endosymbioticus TaxID=2006182 RepID=A0A366MAX0_9EURY|nr:hypothetical protein ALNOE001_16750 [Candidatus Methanobinarius endosymbioticus]